jgi:outer membrane protein TolC
MAVLFPILASAMHAQSIDQPSSLAETGTSERATPSRLPDSPYPDENFALPPNPGAALLPTPHVALAANHEYSLPELIDIAERENPETRVAWERARNTAISEGMASSTYLPLITADVVAGYQGSNGQDSSFGATARNSGNAYGSVGAVSVEWLLFDFGGRKNIVESARSLSEASNIGFFGAHQRIIYGVSIAYYAYLAAVQRYQTAVEALANVRAVEAAAEARYNRGEGTVMETAQSRELTARSQLSVVSAKGLQTEAYADLTAAMGVSPLATIQIAPEERRPLSAEELAPVEQLVHDALARRPDVLGAYTAVQASQAALRAAKAQNRPKIFLAGTGAYVSGELGLSAIPPVGEQLPTLNISGNHWNGTVLVGVSIPIFDAHQHANAVRQAKNNEDRANASLNQVRLNAIREIVIAQNALRTSLAAHDAAGVLKLSAQTSYDAALTSYKEGVGTVTDAVEAETELFQAELADDNAYTSALSAAATLAFATGILGAAPR